MADDIDVKAEGRKMIAGDQQRMRNTASDEEYARGVRSQKGWDKGHAGNRWLSNFYDQPSKERSRNIERDEYLVKTSADRKSGKPRAKARSRSKRGRR